MHMKKKYYLITVGTISLVSGGIYVYKRWFDKKWEENRRWTKQRRMFKLANKWIERLGNHCVVANYFDKKGYKTVAVYGLSTFGKHLIQQLGESNIEVIYGIDRRQGMVDADMRVYLPEDNLPEVDVVVITAIYDYDEIKEELKHRIKCPIVSLEEIIYEG